MNPEELIAHNDFIRGLSRSLVRDDARAADVTQQSFLAAIEHPPAEEKPLRAWLARIARNAASNLRRGESRRRHREREVSLPEGVPSTEEIATREEIRRHVVDALQALDDPYRATILLRYYEDLPPREIARRFNVPVDTVKTRLKRGLGRLRRTLDEKHGSDRSVWATALLPLAGAGATAAGSMARGSTPVETLPTGAGSTGTGPAPLEVLTEPASLAILGAIAVVLTAAFSLYFLSIPGEPIEVVAHSPFPANSVSTPLEGAPAVVPVPAPGREEHAGISGRVTSSGGRPVAGARVFIAWKDRSAPANRPLVIPGVPGEFDDGRFVESDGRGEFAFETGDARSVYACLYDSGDPNLAPYPLFTPRWKPWQGRFIEPPAKDVDFTARARPMATLRVEAVDAGSGLKLRWFSCTVRSGTTGSAPRRTKTYTEGEVTVTLPIDNGKSCHCVVEVRNEKSEEKACGEVLLRANESRHIVLRLGEDRPEIAGTVVDGQGRPVKDALVFAGGLDRMRGDEPFKPFKPRRIKDGVRTGRDGAFRFDCASRRVSVWHATFSPVTVASGEAGEIRLPQRGAIEGRLVDRAGNPERGVEITMDRQVTAVTDGDGRFTFGNVAAGVRGLLLPGKRYVGVVVAPGETAQAAIGPLVGEVTIELRAGGIAIGNPGRAVLVGRGSLFTVHPLRSENDFLSVQDVLPGEYLLMTERLGLAPVTISGSRAVAGFGACDLTVRAAAGTRIFVVPAESGELIELFGGRMARTVPASGELPFGPIPRGRYAIGIGRKGIFSTVSVDGPSAEAVVREESR